MKINMSIIFVLLILFIAHHVILPGDTFASDILAEKRLTVLPDSIDGVKPGDILKNYLNNQIKNAWLKWQSDFEQRTSGDWPAHYSDLKEKFLNAIGGLPERTPLNPELTGTIQKNGYKVEKIIFASRVNHYVTAALFIPDSNAYPPPYPGILIPCGHYENAKAHDEYQSMGALCALNGMAALVFDPIDQGERIQITDDAGKAKLWGTRSHNLSGIQSILLGKNVAQYLIWDGIRALDYLVSRPEINTDLIGITGNSGGATQSSYLFMLDERIKVAALSCYIHNLNAQTKNALGDAEQNIFGQIGFGLDHPDYLMSRAPAPIKILAATHDYFRADAVWETFRYIKRFYTTLGFSERIDILENDAGHNYNKTQREGAVRWLARWLLKNDRPIEEPDIQLLTTEEMQCTPGGNVMLLDGARSVYDINIELFRRLGFERKEFLSRNREEIDRTVERLLGLDDLEALESLRINTTESINRDSYKIEKLILTNKIGLRLPALKYIPKNIKDYKPVLFISQYGKSNHLTEIEKMVKAGKTVLAVDLYGTGETRQKGRSRFRLSENINWEDCFRAYLLGESIVGLRVEDIIQCTNYLINANKDRATRVHLIAVGEVGVPALHAAFLKPDKFTGVRLINTLVSWENVIETEISFNQLSNAVHGALKYYDLPDLVRLLGDKVVIRDPYDATGLAFGKKSSEYKLSDEPDIKGLAGILYGKINFSNPESPDPIDSLNCVWHNKIQKRGRDWAAKWFGYLYSPYDGEVQISIYSNQKVKFALGEIINETLEYDIPQKIIKVHLDKGKFYPLRIEYSQDGVIESYMKITWHKIGEPEKVISSGFLHYSPAQKFRMENDWK